MVFFISAEFIPALLLSPCPGFGEILLDFDESDDDDDDDVEGSAGLDRFGIWKKKSSKIVRFFFSEFFREISTYLKSRVQFVTTHKLFHIFGTLSFSIFFSVSVSISVSIPVSISFIFRRR